MLPRKHQRCTENCRVVSSVSVIHSADELVNAAVLNRFKTRSPRHSAAGRKIRLLRSQAQSEVLDEWHTMGVFPFFGESSPVRGLLFCQPPDYLPSKLHVDRKVIRLLYVAGISEEQLTAGQSEDVERGQFLARKALLRLGDQVSRNCQSSEVAKLSRAATEDWPV